MVSNGGFRTRDGGRLGNRMLRMRCAIRGHEARTQQKTSE
jgi:hypothetical protein